MFALSKLLLGSPLLLPAAPTHTDVEGLPSVDLASVLTEDPAVLFDEPGDGRIWARGTSWKGSFGVEGFVHVPFFGSSAPRNFPVHFGLARATVDGADLEVGQVAGSREGRTIRLARGGFDEVYHVGPESVEQTFEFDSLPAAGDLRIEIPVSTELEPRYGPHGLEFDCDLGSVRYGAATAVDAAGVRSPLAQEWTGSAIRISVPREIVEQASFPLVVDPVVSTFAVTSDVRQQVDVDVAYDFHDVSYLIVYSEVQSATDHDVISVFYDRSTQAIRDRASMDITNVDWRQPRIANCGFTETFLCVAEAGASPARDVFGRTRAADTGTRGPQFQISTGGGDHHAPDVGGFGNDTSTSFSFAVVWQRDSQFPADSDVLGRGVTSSGTLVGNQTGISLGAGDNDRSPRISISSGEPGFLAHEHRYMVVWEREIDPANHDIVARVMDHDMDLTGHAPFSAYTFSNAMDPVVSTQIVSPLSPTPYWVIAFERVIGSRVRIFAIVATDGDADNARDLAVMQNLSFGVDQVDPEISLDGDDYYIVYRQLSAAGHDLYMTVLNVTPDSGELRSGLAERRATLRPLDGTARTLATASVYETGGGLGSNALAVWVARGTSGADTEVTGAVIRESSSHVLGAQYCPATSNSTGVSAWLVARGSYNSPGDTFYLSCVDLPQHTFGYFLVAPSSGYTTNPGGSSGHLCLGSSIGRYSNSVASSGPDGDLSLLIDPTQLAGPNGPIAAAAGEAWYFQCWSRDSVGGMATSNFSNAVEVYFQ